MFLPYKYVVQGFDPVKITVKQIMGNDWMVACMIPKGSKINQNLANYCNYINIFRKDDGKHAEDE